MVFNKFSIQLIIRLLLIVVSTLCLAYVFMLNDYWVTSTNILLAIVLQTWFLYRYVNRFQWDIAYFFESFKYDDFSYKFHEDTSLGAEKLLKKSLNQLTSKIGSLKSESASQRQFYRFVLDQVPVGIVIIKQDEISYSNAVSHEILGLPEYPVLSDLNKCAETFDKIISDRQHARNVLINISASDMENNISVRSREILVDDEPVLVLSIMNVQNELDRYEVASWQRLINVLTHEIMNSIVPVTSLASKLINSMQDEEGIAKNANQITDKNIIQVLRGLRVIENRGEGLMDFVENYRLLSGIPAPVMSQNNLKEIIDEVTVLTTELTGEYGITVIDETDGDDQIFVDKNQIIQALINLVKNGVIAMKNSDRKILRIIGGISSDGYSYVSVSDTGCGIAKDTLSKIFIPFFTTREGGSGIGLSFARQVMYLHEGILKVTSKEEEGSIFTMVFSK